MQNPFKIVENYCKTLFPFNFAQQRACADLRTINHECKYEHDHYFMEGFVKSRMADNISDLNIELNMSKEKFINELFSHCGRGI